jgi:hypothetical protein
VNLTIPLPDGLDLVMSEGPPRGEAYATRQLQQGFRLIDRGEDLSEEAVGFGLPVVKRGSHTFFPGRVCLASERAGSLWRVEALFTFNLEERLSRGLSPSLRGRPIYVAKDLLAAIIRRSHHARGLLTAASTWLRSSLDLKTVYEQAAFRAALEVHFAIDSATGVIQVWLDASPLVEQGVTELIMMNEQGGHFFDAYRDSAGGTLGGAKIGAWERVTAPEAAMGSSTREVVYTVAGGDGARLYRGREVVGSRLAWSGFGYSFNPALGNLEYVIRIGRGP